MFGDFPNYPVINKFVNVFLHHFTTVIPIGKKLINDALSTKRDLISRNSVIILCSKWKNTGRKIRPILINLLNLHLRLTVLLILLFFNTWFHFSVVICLIIHGHWVLQTEYLLNKCLGLCFQLDKLIYMSINQNFFLSKGSYKLSK
jgi:hypothetical protein